MPRMTARGYIVATLELGVDRQGGEQQLTDELIGQICERVRRARPDGHGESWHKLLKEEKRIKAWVDEGLTVVKIDILVAPPGSRRPPSHSGALCDRALRRLEETADHSTRR